VCVCVVWGKGWLVWCGLVSCVVDGGVMMDELERKNKWSTVRGATGIF
jgi:hypothetical protein